MIVHGEFDRYLVRPLNPLFQIIAEKFQPDGFGELIVGIIILIIAWSKIGLKVTLGRIVCIIVAYRIWLLSISRYESAGS